MSVGFDVSANTQSAQAAIRQLREAFKDLAEEGKQFSEIDLSGTTGDLKRDLEIIKRNWADILRSQKEFRKRLQATGQENKAPWEIDFRRSHAGFSNAQLESLQKRLLESLLHGISGKNPDVPIPDILLNPNRNSPSNQNNNRSDSSPGNRPRHQNHDGDEESRSSGLTRGIKGLLGGGLNFGLSMFGLAGGLAGIAGKGIEGAEEINKNTDEFMRRTHDLGNSFELLRQQISSAGNGFAVANDEMSQLVLQFTRASYAKSVEEATAGTRASVGLAVGYGANPGQITQQMSGLALIGATGQGELTTREKKFALRIGQVVGQHAIPLETGLQNFSRLAENYAQRTGENVPVETIMGYLKSLYDVGEKNKSLRGEAGISLLNRADEGIRNANDPATDLMLYQGLSSIMGTQNYLLIKKQIEKGAFAPVPNPDGSDSGETTFSVYLKQLEKHYSAVDPNAVPFALSNSLNIGGMNMAEKLIEVQKNYQGGVKGYQDDLSKYGVNIEGLNEAGIKDTMEILSAKTLKEKFEMAQKKLNTPFSIPLSDTERERLNNLRNEAAISGDPKKQEAFIREMVKISAEHGMKATPFSEMQTTLADIKNVLITNIGEPIVDLASYIAGFAQEKFGYGVNQQKANQKYLKNEQAGDVLAAKAVEDLAPYKERIEQAKGDPKKHKEAIDAYNNRRNFWQDWINKNNKESEKNYQEANPGFFRGKLKIFRLFDERSPNEKKFNDLPSGLSEADTIADLEEEKKKILEEHRRNPIDDNGNTRTDTQEKIKKINEQIDALKKNAVRKATGGIVPGGFGGGDRIPAMLTPGEFVVNAQSAQKNQGLLYAINDNTAPLGFAAGGSVGTSAANTIVPVPDPETPNAVRDLQKRMDQLFDPVTKSLEELAQHARSMQSKAFRQADPSVLAWGNVITPDGTVISIANTAAANGGNQNNKAAQLPFNIASDPRFKGDGRGFLSLGDAAESSANGTPYTGPVAKNLSTKNAGQFAKDPAFLAHLKKLEQENGLMPGLLYGVMMAESSGNPNLTSPKGAEGLFQFMPGTAKRFGLKNSFDPYASANAAAKYLSWIRKQSYVKNWAETAAGYNAGEGAVQKAGGIPNFSETQKYVPRVLGYAQKAPYLTDTQATIGETNPSIKAAQDAAQQKTVDGGNAQTSIDASKMTSPNYTEKPADVATPSAEISAQNAAHLNITLTQRNQNGEVIGDTIEHKMNLSTPKPTGSIEVPDVNHAPGVY